VLMAVKQHPELNVQGGNPPSLVYTLKRKTQEELLQSAVKVMQSVISDYEALAADDSEGTEETE